MKFKHGTYRHLKGHMYETIGIAKHSETLEDMVIYVNQEDEKEIWVRPLSMFTDEVTRDGKTFKRFEFLG